MSLSIAAVPCHAPLSALLADTVYGTLFSTFCQGRYNTTTSSNILNTYPAQATLLYFGGLGSLQKRSNDLNTTTAGYSETFQSSLQVRNLCKVPVHRCCPDSDLRLLHRCSLC